MFLVIYIHITPVDYGKTIPAQSFYMVKCSIILVELFLLNVCKNKAHIITRANIAYGFKKQMYVTHPLTCFVLLYWVVGEGPKQFLKKKEFSE